MVLPAEVAVKFEVEPGHTGLGVAVKPVGTDGAIPVTVTVTAVRVQLILPVAALNASAKYVVVPPGLTLKFAALALDPMETPPVATVYHLIVSPAEVAFKLELPPHATVAGVALTAVGDAKLPGVQVKVKPDAGNNIVLQVAVAAFDPPATEAAQPPAVVLFEKSFIGFPLRPTWGAKLVDRVDGP